MGSKQTKNSASNNNKKTEAVKNPANNLPPAKKKSTSSNNLKALSKNEVECIQKDCFISEAEIKNKYDIFMAFSDNGQKLNEKSFYELCLSLKNEIPEHLRKYSSMVFRSIDTDHDHLITFYDFIVAYQSILKGDVKKKLEYAFYLYDSDGTGRLDVNKIKNVIEIMLKVLQADKNFNAQTVAENCLILLDKRKFGFIVKGNFYFNFYF
jgi:Ca2+-binding EF-hand superfamily protein